MKRKMKQIRWNTVRLLAAGFLAIILLGGVLLWLPVCNREPLCFFDALFTAVSAVCVTGLVTITPAAQFTAAGQAVLLILIQIGGLGVIACVTSFFLILRRKITLQGRVIIQESYNLDAPGGMVRFVRQVLRMTFFVEGAGAALYALRFIPEFGPVRGLWYAIFHSVSAFCNAGIDILGPDSFAAYAGSPIINLTTMLLIVAGGLGFTVWQDILANARRVHTLHQPKKWYFTRLSLHSRLALLTTLILIAAGTAVFLAAEWRNPATLGKMGFGEKVMASLFQSVTTRTAGFATVPQKMLRTQSRLAGCILMLVGGSPGGTAGGIKTTTVAMFVLACVSVVKGRRDVECFGKRISNRNIHTGLAVVMVTFTVLAAGVLGLVVLEPGTELSRILYEAASAIGTVGLTADLTPQLGRASQVILMILMYIGRIGPVTFALLFGGKARAEGQNRELPEQRIMVG